MNDNPEKKEENEESSDELNAQNGQTQSDSEFDSDDRSSEIDQTIISDQWDSETINSDTFDTSESEELFQTSDAPESEQDTYADPPSNEQTIDESVPKDDIYATIVDPESVDLDQTMESDEQGDWAGMLTINENPDEQPEDRNDQTLILDDPVENSDIGATFVEDGTNERKQSEPGGKNEQNH